MIAANLVCVQLPKGHVIAEPGEMIEHVYFPVSGVGSIVARSPEGHEVEAGLFGLEGFSPVEVALGSDRSPHKIIMQVADDAWQLSAEVLREAMEASPALRGLLLRYVQTLSTQGSYTALSNAMHSVDERLARWILMIADRLDRPTIHITHEFLAGMLGVGRTGVTLALHDLEDAGLIGTGRKRIDLLDRKGLEQLTSGFYGFAEREYDRLVTHAPAPATAAPRVQLVAR